jgi:hypothetical protein
MNEYYDEMVGLEDGREIAISDMDDKHLFNAYRQSQYQPMFREMVLRLFESRIKENTK